MMKAASHHIVRRGLNIAAALLIGSLTFSTARAAGDPAADGLVLVSSKRLAKVYLKPGADFRPYTKVMFDPTEVEFAKNWQRDYNRGNRGLQMKITDKDIEKATETVRTQFGEDFAKAYNKAGYQVVTTPGPEVLRMRTGVVNMSVSAPDKRTAGNVRSFSREAGYATLVLEARDSQSGALLGRAFDQRLAGDTPLLMRNSVTNRSDFSRLFRDWAKESVAGLASLKSASAEPLSASTAPK